MRVHSGKPFPISFYERSSLRLKHFLVWWCVCNELDADASGWIHISREDMEEIFSRTQHAKPNQITSILQTLGNYGYLEFSCQKGKRLFNTESYSFRVLEDAWEPKHIVKKQYQSSYTLAERRERARLRRLNPVSSGFSL